MANRLATTYKAPTRLFAYKLHCETRLTNQLFIIGNGFDLHHNIASRYSDFASFLESRDRATFDITTEYMVPERDLWSCLEERLAEVDVDQIEEYASNFLVSYGADDWSDAYHHDYEYEIEQICAAISSKLRSHFADWVRQIVIPPCAVSPVRCIDPQALFLNFNYTSTLQEIYGVSDNVSCIFTDQHGTKPARSYWDTGGIAKHQNYFLATPTRILMFGLPAVSS